MSKQYGLIIPDKSKGIKRPTIFNDDSDSDDNARPTGISTLKKQEVRAQERALAEDPTVYQYDELYDDMQSQRKESKLARKDLDKKPKYINKLLESAERRKRENERRIERQVQKEREEEGDEFKDKESFVTTGYRKKLEELKELEEKEKREEYLESIGDVRKQGDLSGFYRHLYDQKLSEGDKTVEVKIEAEEPAPKVCKKRKYRKRGESVSSDSGEERTIKREHLPSNLDADSDFAIDSDTESEGEAVAVKKEAPVVDAPVAEVKTEEAVDEDEKPVVEEPKKPKIDIWKKRTVGDVFTEALQRYFVRKSQRTQAV